MNVPLLRKIQEKIKLEPQAFNMYNFDGVSECGTSHCIGGWACDIEGTYPSTSFRARLLLDLTIEQAGRLFFPDKEAMKQFGQYDMTPEQAVARIDLFIETNGEI